MVRTTTLFRSTLALLAALLLGLSAPADGKKPSEPSNPTSFQTYLAPEWTTLVGRADPNQSSAVKREYHVGQPIKVVRVTEQGQTISRGRIDGRKSSVWYYTSDGCWIWSGGTTDPKWNK
jgi:hypothetical protein